MKRYLSLFLMLGGLLTGTAAGVVLFRPYLLRSDPPLEPRAPLVIDASSAPGAQPPHIRGNDSATVTIEEFGDFECPPCKRLYDELKQIEPDYAHNVRFIFRQFPLTSIHKNAMEAARAAEAAGAQGRFWEMHDRLLETQEAWAQAPDARALFIDYAQSLALDTERFTQDLDSPELNGRILADQQRVKSVGVRGTPTLFINGRELQGEDRTPDGIRRAINAALGIKQVKLSDQVTQDDN
jgi:protein-disulfide isomerase